MAALIGGVAADESVLETGSEIRQPIG